MLHRFDTLVNVSIAGVIISINTFVYWYRLKAFIRRQHVHSVDRQSLTVWNRNTRTNYVSTFQYNICYATLCSLERQSDKTWFLLLLLPVVQYCYTSAHWLWIMPSTQQDFARLRNVEMGVTNIGNESGYGEDNVRYRWQFQCSS